MPYVGIKKYSYRPEESDYNELLNELSNLLSFHKKSDYWKLGKYPMLFTYSGQFLIYNPERSHKIDVPYGNIEWTVGKYKTAENILKHFDIDSKNEVDIFVRPRKIMIRRFCRFDEKTKRDRDNFIQPITEKEYNRLKDLPQPFYSNLNFKK